MSAEQVQELRELIRETKASIKKLRNKEDNATNRILINAYEGSLERSQVALRGLMIRVRVEKHGINYDDWWTWALTQYKIEQAFGFYVVVSLARDWHVDMRWEFADEISSKEKIAQLCGYKIYDRKRGRGDMNQDLKEV